MFVIIKALNYFFKVPTLSDKANHFLSVIHGASFALNMCILVQVHT